MAITVLPEKQNFGNVLGTGLGSGLQALANMKLQQLGQQQERQRYTKAIEQLPGMTPQIANFLSALAPEERKNVWSNIGSLMQLGGGGISPQREGMMQGQVLPQEASQQGNLLENLFKSPQQRIQEETLGIKKAKEEREVAKEAREFSEPFINKAQAAKANIHDYNGLIKLVETGKEDIRSPNVTIALSKVGMEGMNQSPTTQLVQKLSARLAQNSSTAFGPGTRVTNFLEKTFQQSIPSLFNTPEGILTISKYNKTLDKVNLVNDQVRRDIIKENKGKIPGDIRDQIYERAEPKTRKLQDKALKILMDATKKSSSSSIPRRVSSIDNIPDNSIFTDKMTGKAMVKKNGVVMPYEG